MSLPRVRGNIAGTKGLFGFYCQALRNLSNSQINMLRYRCVKQDFGVLFVLASTASYSFGKMLKWLIRRTVVAGSNERSGDQFIWNEGLAVGNDQMDEEHKILIGYLNTIGEYKRKYEAGDTLSRTVVAAMVKRLVDYTVFHFRDEELLLARYGYPNLASHKAIHKHLIEQLNILADKFETVGVDIVPVLFNFVSVWLKDHIMGVDQRYTSYVGKKDRNG